MRTAIILGCLLIAAEIDNIAILSGGTTDYLGDGITKMYGIIISVGIIMDVIDFIKNLSK